MSAPATPDHSIQLLAELCASAGGRRVWVADENASAASSRFQFDEETLIVTNRIDVYRSHLHQRHLIELSDFSFEKASAGEIDAIFYRVSKEKPLVHHVLNSSAQLLRDGGSLYLAGNKGDGTKSYYDKARQLLGVEEAVWKKEKHGAYCGHVTKSSTAAQTPLDTQSYPELRLVTEVEGVRFYSKPGIFGWSKTDQGSALLIERLPGFIQTLGRLPTGVLDLGCGFGFLAVMAGRQLQVPITATDNNVAAVAACKHNMEINGIRGQVLLDDCGSDIDAQFDAILCNPPFHQGFSTQSQHTQGFLQHCQRLLAPGGAALFVVNQFIPLESMAAPLFSRVERFCGDGSFKLITLRH